MSRKNYGFPMSPCRSAAFFPSRDREGAFYELTLPHGRDSENQKIPLRRIVTNCDWDRPVLVVTSRRCRPSTVGRTRQVTGLGRSLPSGARSGGGTSCVMLAPGKSSKPGGSFRVTV